MSKLPHRACSSKIVGGRSSRNWLVRAVCIGCRRGVAQHCSLGLVYLSLESISPGQGLVALGSGCLRSASGVVIPVQGRREVGKGADDPSC